MFKAAFPWASLAEEEAERKYQKTFPSAGLDEVAGSVWIAPEEGELFRYPITLCKSAPLIRAYFSAFTVRRILDATLDRGSTRPRANREGKQG